MKAKWFVLLCYFTTMSLYALSPFKVNTLSVIQNMVAGSSQSITLQLTTQVPPSSAVNIHCDFHSSSSNLTASFNQNGCTSAGGIGINSSLPATVTLTLTTASGASAPMTGTVTFTQTNGRHAKEIVNLPIAINPSSRTITFTNHCPFNVWFGISSSSIPAKNTGTIACQTNQDCSAYTYSQCVNGACGGGVCTQDNDCVNSHAGTCQVPANSPPNTTASCTYCAEDSDCLSGGKCDTANHQCFWQIPAPADASTNHYLLAPPSQGVVTSNTINIQDFSALNGYALQWGGGFAGRTNCTFSNQQLNCATASCNSSAPGDGQGGCQLGVGFSAPTTQAETTFVNIFPDTYDITLINGANIPMSMRPTPLQGVATPTAYGNPFLCGYAGGRETVQTSNGNLGGCSWNYTLPSLGYQWVDTDNNQACQQDETCTQINTAYRCGLTKNAINNNSAQMTCGSLLGIWSQNQICIQNANYSQSAIIDCTQQNLGTNSLINLLSCSGNAATSCYNVTSGSTTCCGCANWQNEGIIMPSNPDIVQQCTYPNINWTNNILSGLSWLKQACPSAYVFPFDDKSSTFTCPSNNAQSGVNYTIDFCPQIT